MHGRGWGLGLGGKGMKKTAKGASTAAGQDRAELLTGRAVHGRSPEGGGDPLEPFNSRLPRSLQRRLKVHAALHGAKIQDVLGAALDDYLQRRGS